MRLPGAPRFHDPGAKGTPHQERVMKRDLSTLTRTEYDVAIIGGGISGACAAWDAALRGLSVALVDSGDFCGGTSANSYKIVHGGIRYLQHADFIRLRSSCAERSALLHIAPHLVQPLPIVVPTYGSGKSGKFLLGAGAVTYDVLTFDRNRNIKDSTRKIPWTCFLNREEILEKFRGLPQEDLTGGVVFWDGQMYNPTRLVLSFVKSAVGAGADAANYAKAVSFLRTADRVQGLNVLDLLTGDTFSIRAKVVLNATGPWAETLLARALGKSLKPPGTYSRDTCFVVRRRVSDSYALALQGRTRDPDALMGRPARHLFMVPWRDRTVVGVWHVVYDKGPDKIIITEDEVQSFLDEINWAYPGFNLSRQDVTMWHAGLVPFGENAPGAVHLRYGKRSRLIDHETSHGLKGLVTLIAIRYTMARGDASRAMDLVTAKLGKIVHRPRTERLPIDGGDIEDFEGLVQNIVRSETIIDEKLVRALAHNHGSNCAQVLRYAREDPTLSQTLGSSTVLKAEVVNAVRNEMVLKLSDVVFRRTDLGTGGNPGEQALRTCANLVAKELGWNVNRTNEELREVRKCFPAMYPTSGGI